ncbi:MAG: methyltransferase [Chloroflexota bacterium]
MKQDFPATDPVHSSREAVGGMFRLIGGYRVSQALNVVAQLGVADLLAERPQTIRDLARSTKTKESVLYRIMRFLTGAGVFEEVTPRTFALTDVGQFLREDHPRSLRPVVLQLMSGAKWDAWKGLMDTVRTGETAFDRVHGVGLFDYYREHPAQAADFNAAMNSNTAHSVSEISKVYDFSGIKLLVDVGGGHGLLLSSLLQHYPHMHGVLFDLPAVVSDAGQRLEEAGVANRCDVAGGNFFESVPPGDAYILRQIIHDWDDARATTILTNCRSAMQGSGKVLVVECGVGSDYRTDMHALHLDLEMLVSLGGIQRTEEEYSALFDAAGLRLSAVHPLGDALHFSIYEGVLA